MSDIIKKEVFYKHPVSRVWKAISDSRELSAWFIKADFEPVVGYNYIFMHENTTITGTVLEANPVYTLVYTWILGGTNVTTTVRWELKEQGAGTLLRLEHSGISNYETATAIKMFAQYSGGWDGCFAGLEKYLMG